MWGLVALQLVCAMFFLVDIVASVLSIPLPVVNWQIREILEILAVLGLLLGSYFGVRMTLAAQDEAKRASDALKIASGAIGAAVTKQFETWGYTPAENEVAWLLVKGFSLTEIAGIRGTSEGTVKAQCNAVYRKAGVSGRAQLLASFVEDLFVAADE